MSPSKDREGAVEEIPWQKCLPAVTAVAIIAGGFGALYAQLKFDDWEAARSRVVALQLVPLLLAVVTGLAAGIAVWMMQKSRRRGSELEAANRTLAQVNEQLKLETINALHSEQRFRLLFSSNPCPMWIFDCDTLAITDANDAALRQYGYTRSEFLSLTALDLRPPEEHGRFVTRLRESGSGLWIAWRLDSPPQRRQQDAGGNSCISLCTRPRRTRAGVSSGRHGQS